MRFLSMATALVLSASHAYADSKSEEIAEALANGATCYVTYSGPSGRGSIVGDGSYRVSWNSNESIWTVAGPHGANRAQNTDHYHGPHPAELLYNHWGVTFRIADDGTVATIDEPEVTGGSMACPD